MNCRHCVVLSVAVLSQQLRRQSLKGQLSLQAVGCRPCLKGECDDGTGETCLLSERYDDSCCIAVLNMYRAEGLVHGFGKDSKGFKIQYCIL